MSQLAGGNLLLDKILGMVLYELVTCFYFLFFIKILIIGLGEFSNVFKTLRFPLNIFSDVLAITTLTLKTEQKKKNFNFKTLFQLPSKKAKSKSNIP